MPVRPLNPTQISPSTAAMFDLLADGQWHSNDAIVAAGMGVCMDQEREDALRNGYRTRAKTLAKGVTIAEADILASGAKDLCRNRLMIAVRSGRVERDGKRHRMIEQTVAQWRTARPNLTFAPAEPVTTPAVPAITTPAPAPAPEPTPAAEINVAEDTAPGKPRGRRELIFGGITEEQGFAAAPRATFDRVHFQTDFPIPLADFRADLPADTVVSFDDGSGLYRVDGPVGTGKDLAAFVKAWCKDHNLTDISLTVVPKPVSRRALNDLNPAFLDDLCRHYGPLSYKRMQRNLSTLRMHYSENDDIAQRINEWILEAIVMFDESKGVPFGAFLNQQLTKWVHNLNRAAYGRTITDAELKQQRALAAFQQQHQRMPSEAELAATLGQSVAALRNNSAAIATINGLRNINTIDAGVDDPEIPLPGEDRVEDQMMDDVERTLLSAALTASCSADPDAKGRAAQPNVLGFVTWYGTTYGKKSKTDLSADLDTSMRNMNVYQERAAARLRERLAS